MLGVVFEKSSLTVEGETAQYYSSSQGCRHFCPVCGSSLFFTFDNYTKDIEIMAGVFDNSDFIEPTHHLHTSQALNFFKVDDDLPKHKEGLEK